MDKLMSKKEMKEYEKELENMIKDGVNYPFHPYIREFLEYADEHSEMKEDPEFQAIVNYVEKREKEKIIKMKRGIIDEEDPESTQFKMMTHYFNTLGIKLK